MNDTPPTSQPFRTDKESLHTHSDYAAMKSAKDDLLKALKNLYEDKQSEITSLGLPLEWTSWSNMAIAQAAIRKGEAVV